MGVAFDGDFDRCCFDAFGRFIPGEYIVGLLAEIFLNKEIGGKIVHDPRVVWNTRDIVTRKEACQFNQRLVVHLLNKACVTINGCRWRDLSASVLS